MIYCPLFLYKAMYIKEICCIMSIYSILLFERKGRDIMIWQELESKVREIACLRWDCNATTETIAGVKCDCVLKPSSSEWILVEVTKERNIEKVRADVIKLQTVMFQQCSGRAKTATLRSERNDQFCQREIANSPGGGFLV